MRSRRSLARSSTGGGGALNKSSEFSSGVRFENVDEVDDAMRLCEDYHVLLASIKTQSSEASSMKGNDSSAIFSDIQSEVDNSNSLDAGPPLQPPVSARSNASDMSSSHSPKSNSTTAILPTPPKVDSNGVSPRAAMHGVVDKPSFEEPLPPVVGEADLTSVETAPLRVVPVGDDSGSQHFVSSTSNGTAPAAAKQESPQALGDGHRVGSFNTNTWGHLVQALQAKHLRSARTPEHQRSVHELCKVIRDLGLLASGLVTTVETMEARQRAQDGQLHVDGMGSDDDIQSLISNEDADERDMGGDAETRDRVAKPPLAPRRVSPTNESISNSMPSPPAVNLPPALQGFMRSAQGSGSTSPAEPQSLSFPTSQNVSGAPSPSSRRRSVHFKKTGAFGEDEPEALDLAHLGTDTAAAGMTQTIVRLLHRKSVTVHNHVRRTTDATGYEMVNDFLILEELGRGANGTVFFVLDTRTSREFAMKEIKRAKFQQMDSGGGIGSNTVSPRAAKSPGTPNGMLSAGALTSTGAMATALISAQPSSFNREVAIMKKLRHKNICTLHEVIDDPKSNSIFLIMDLVSGGRIAPDLDLATGKCTPVPFTRVRKYVGQIAQGLHYLHRHGIAHRDLKPDNILLTEEDDVVLVDFGVSMEGDRDGFVKGFAGTPAFVAPEVWSTDSGRAVDGNSADMWSLGVTTYMMLFGCSPFVAPNTFQLQRMIEESPVEFPDDFDRRHWKDLITRLMAKSPSDRIKVDEVKIHPALDPDLDESLEGFTVQPTEEEMVFAISGRRTSVTPDCESMRRVSETMEQPGSMLPTVTLRKASLAAGASGSPKEEPFREAHGDLKDTLPPISGRRGKQ